MSDFIPVNAPLLAGNVRAYLNECIDTGWISSEGPFVKRFEEDFAKYLDRSYCAAVTNGSAALDLAVTALQLEEGDEVIMPSFTIISCASAVIRAGAKPVLVDCDTATWNMKTAQIESRVTPRTKVIMVVHIYGLPVDMDPVLEIANKYGLSIVEDTAEAIGLSYKGKRCGSFGDISIFSFYANKHVTTGEGGMVATNSVELIERSRYFRNLCFTEDRFVHTDLGWNMRMTNLQAAIGLAQLEYLDETVKRKIEMGRRYTERLQEIEGIQLPVAKMDYAENNYWVYGIVLGDNIPFNAKQAMAKLAEEKIGTRPFFWPMHEQPVFLAKGLFDGETYPVSERIARRGFYIPSGASITDEQIDQVSDAVIRLFK